MSAAIKIQMFILGCLLLVFMRRTWQLGVALFDELHRSNDLREQDGGAQ